MIEEHIEIHRLSETEAVLARLKAVLSQSQVPREKALDIQLCFSEALNNALVHGNGGDPALAVQVCWRIGAGVFCFSVADQGGGIAGEKRRPELADVLAEHGKGIYLISALMDKVWFNEKGNQINGEMNWS